MNTSAKNQATSKIFRIILLALVLCSSFAQAEAIRVYPFISADYVRDVATLTFILEKRKELIKPPAKNSFEEVGHLLSEITIAKLSLYQGDSPIFTSSFNYQSGRKYLLLLYNTGIPQDPISSLLIKDKPEELIVGMGYVRVVNIASMFTKIITQKTKAPPRFSLYKVVGRNNKAHPQEIIFSQDLGFGVSTSFLAVLPSKDNELGYCFFDRHWPEEITCEPFRLTNSSWTTVIFADYEGNRTLVHVDFRQP